MTQLSTEARRALEAILFLADEPVAASTLAQLVEAPRREVEETLRDLSVDFERRGSGLALREVAGGWRLYTHPDVGEYVERYVLSSKHVRLTKAALETLSIIAYKQPVTRHQIGSIRGVNPDGVLRALTDRGLVEEVGREGPGRAVLYGTTPEFLERMGLASLSDLPSISPLLLESPEGADAGGRESLA